ncbi:MAG: ISNCY family transposase [Verrucomicrobia bacterium]|nr:ISNCY family transposase [Verrucomicrobiota bacterium]
MEEVISMTQKELDRLSVVAKVGEKRLSQEAAGALLGLSTRQVRRLLKRYKQDGAKGLISKKRGRPGNHAIPHALKEAIIELLKSSYSDFGPLLATEKLEELHQIKVSISSVRNIMVRSGLWSAKAKKKRRLFQLRERRSREGELQQIDGSPHPWFEERGPSCSLIYTLDDATGKIGSASFCGSETTWNYMSLLKNHIEKHGRPLALYSDKHGVFRVNHREALTGSGITQFGRAMKELGIELIFANTPQAKGRIERMNQTLQDRLVKELRLQKISTPEEANAFLPTFIDSFNKRFAVAPKNPDNAHRELLSEHNLEAIFTIKEERRLSKSLEFQYKSIIYQVVTEREGYALSKARIEISEDEKGAIKAYYKGKRLHIRRYGSQEGQREEVNAKELNALLDNLAKQEVKSKYRPSRRHPWKRYPRNTSPVYVAA